MSVTGLFAGIGGFELAFSQAGFETELLVENDPAASAVLKARFPDADLQSDVMDLADIPSSTTIVTAGFPCQNLSMAGDKSGIAGSKSGVVAKMFELIGRSRVPVVVIENVYFMLQLDSGKAMLWLVDRFEQLRYKWAYRVLDTMGFGLPQRRRRVYFVASREIDPRSILFADETSSTASAKPDLKNPLGFYWTEGRSGIGLTVDGIPPLKVGSAVGIASAPAVLFPDGQVLMPSLQTCEKLQGFDPGWTAVVNNHNVRRRPEWRMVGNAVSIPVARWVAGRIKKPGAVLDFDRVSLGERKRWPDAGWNVGEGRVGILASDKPIATSKPSISAFRDSTWMQLSDRALNGFIARAVDGGLRIPDGFLEALRRADRRVIDPSAGPRPSRKLDEAK
ncbi:MAG TPA: DNA (cytosine-5-)-methyltransferase [Candidatus Binatia bacterium]